MGQPKESTPHHFLPSIKRGIAESVTRQFYTLDISAESTGRIRSLRQDLESDPTKQLLIYFNHLSYDDPGLALYIAHQIDPHNKRKLVLPVSEWHNQWKHNPKYAAFTKLGAFLYDFDAIPVIQTYQVEKPEVYGYTYDDAFTNNRKLMRAVKSLRDTGQPLTFLIAPEGHRSDTGALGRTEEGITNIGRSLAPVVYCPVALNYPEGFTRGTNAHLFLKPHVTISVGELTYQHDRQDKVLLETLMVRLAQALPPSGRGIWGEVK